MCLGYAPIDSKVKSSMVQKTSLSKYQVAPEVLSQDDVIIPSRRLQPLVNTDRNKGQHIPKIPTTPERYNTDALDKYRVESEQANDGNPPPFDEKQFDPEEQRLHSFIQLQRDDEISTISLDEATGTMYVQDMVNPAKKDYTEDPTVFVDRAIYSGDLEKDKARLKAKEELRKKIDEKIVQLVEAKCLAPKVDGKPCHRQVLEGFNTCFSHLSATDRKKFLLQKGKQV